MSSRDAVAIVKGVSSNAVAILSFSVIDCKSFASSTFSIDIIEPRDADACQ